MLSSLNFVMIYCSGLHCNRPSTPSLTQKSSLSADLTPPPPLEKLQPT
jgi:hypothetical protein